MPNFPPTILVVHPKEKRSKCTVEPLRCEEEFLFCKFPNRPSCPLEGYVRLGIGGPMLSRDDAERGLLVLDGTWRLAEVMERDYADLPVRSLPAWETAYPRTSKLFDDPQAGLATIEAIFVAHTILGRDTSQLLNQYHWQQEFLAKNQSRIEAAADS